MVDLSNDENWPTWVWILIISIGLAFLWFMGNQELIMIPIGLCFFIFEWTSKSFNSIIIHPKFVPIMLIMILYGIISIARFLEENKREIDPQTHKNYYDEDD